MVVDDIQDHSDAIEMEEIDHRFELIGLAGQLRGGQRRLALLGEELVDHCQIPGQIGALHGVICFGREDVGAVVAAAGRRLEFRDGQRHDGVDAEIGQIFHAAKHVEVFRDSVFADVVAGVIDGIKDTDVELVNEQIVERWRMKSRVVPWISGRVADDAVVLWPAREAEFTRVRVAFISFRSIADDPKAVFVAFLHAGKEAGPMRAANVDEQIGIVWGPAGGRIQVEIATDDVNSFGVAAPDAEGGASDDHVRAHRCGGGDEVLGGWHRLRESVKRGAQERQALSVKAGSIGAGRA